MRSILATTVVAGLAVSGAVASNVINEHSGYYQEDVHYTIVTYQGNDVGVYINEGSVSTQLWKFEAFDSESDDPGYIDYIRIDPTGETVGPIKLSIVGAPGHTYGAEDVQGINLTDNADDTTEIYSIFIDGDLGATAAIEADNIGTVSAAGSLLHDISAADDITGTITIGGSLLGGIYADSIASVNVSGVATHTGNIYRRDTST